MSLSENILYELINAAEWPIPSNQWGTDPPTSGGNTTGGAASLFSRLLQLTSAAQRLLAPILPFSPKLTPQLASVVESSTGWKLSFCSVTGVVAVLQEGTLEVRHAKHHYQQAIARAEMVRPDVFPCWRRLAWSPSGSVLAVGYSCGVVQLYTALVQLLYTIYPDRYQEGVVYSEPSAALAALHILEDHLAGDKWVCEVVCVEYSGVVRGYHISATEGYQPSHTFSLLCHYSQGITAATIHKSLLVVAGPSELMSDPSLSYYGLGHGITLWRRLSQHPYYKQVSSVDEDSYVAPVIPIHRRLSSLFCHSIVPANTACSVRVSRCGHHLCVLHISGAVSVWKFPSLTRSKYWQLRDQPEATAVNVLLSPGEVAAAAALQQRLLKAKGGRRGGSGVLKAGHPIGLEWWCRDEGDDHGGVGEDGLVLVRNTGALSISSSTNFTNLLGENAEFLAGTSTICEPGGGEFLCLELERKVSRRRHPSTNPYEGAPQFGGADTDATHEEEEDLGYIARMLMMFWSILFWLTDDQRFQVWPLTVMSEKYRLVWFKSSSPEQMFDNKIRFREYGEALVLAKTYGLDTDLVYQDQWVNCEPNLDSIADYLCRVRNREWTLQQCLVVVPADLLAARELLMYGLRGTDLHVLANMGSGEDVGEWESGPCEFDSEDEEHRKQLKEQQEQLTGQIQWHHLTEDQKGIIRIRQRLLQYIDRLNTYEFLLGGSKFAMRRYDPKFYATFRDQSVIAACHQFARDGDVDALRTMWSNHGAETLPHRLATLSNIPPTIGPYEYRVLLPMCGVEGEEGVYEWEQAKGRHRDWSEEERLVGRVPGCSPSQRVGDVCALYAGAPGLVELGEGHDHSTLTPALVSAWYRQRARQLERDCGLVDAALDLLKLARERNVPSLDPLLSELCTLEVLVYEAGHTHLSLQQLQQLQHVQVITKLMDKSEGSVLQLRVREWLIPYLNRCEAAQPGDRDRLVGEYLRDQSQHGLHRPNEILQFLRCQPPVLLGPALHACAASCVYACERTDQLAEATRMLDALPADDQEGASVLVSVREAVWCLGVLQRHGVSLPPAALANVMSQDALNVYTKVAQAAVQRTPALSCTEWEQLIDDLLELQDKVFSCTAPDDCYEAVLEALLSSRSSELIKYAGQLMGGGVGVCPLSPDDAAKLVISVAKGYFNTAAHYRDDSIHVAKQCLDLAQVEDNEALLSEVQQEKDLITALEILHEFNVDKLPIQVRLCAEPVRLVMAAISSSPSSCLQYWWRVMQLAHLLRVPGDKQDREAAVLVMLATKALQLDELETCYSLCVRITDLSRSEGWEVCAQLAQQAHYPHLDHKALLLDYALTYCPHQHLARLVQIRKCVELAVVCDRAQQQMRAQEQHESGEYQDQDDLFQDADDTLSPAPSSPDAGLLQATKDATLATTALLTSVGTKAFWTSAARWLVPLQEQCKEVQEEQPDADNEEFEQQGCHTFFIDNCSEGHESDIGYRYSGYSAPQLPAMEFSMHLLRAAMMQGGAASGEATARVLQELSSTVLQQDAVMGLSLLMTLQLPQHAREVLQALPHTDIAIQLTRYYYALQIYGSVYPWPGPTMAPMYLHDPSTVIGCASHIVATYRQYEQDETDHITDGDEVEMNGVRILTGGVEVDKYLVQYYDYFAETESLLDDYVQGQALHRLDAGVDVQRFLQDNSYKEDTVLGLCMTTDKNILELAVVLARKYNVSLWQVHMTQMQYLFGSEISTVQLEKDVRNRKVMDTLKTRPHDFQKTMQSKVLNLIDGIDHERLIFFYTILSSCESEEKSPSQGRQHIEVLKQLQTIAPGLSYHCLLLPQPDVLDQLGVALTSANVSAVSCLVSRLPPHCPVTSSAVYCAWAVRHFLRSDGTKQWRDRFRDIQQQWSHLDPADARVLLMTLLLSEDAFKSVPLAARLKLLDEAAATVAKGAPESSWVGLTQDLVEWKCHLTGLQAPGFTALTTGPDLTLRKYAAMYGCSGGSSAAVSQLCQRLLLETGDLHLLRELVSVVEEGAAPQPEDVLHELIQLALDRMGEEVEMESDPLAPAHLPPTAHPQWWLERLACLTHTLAEEEAQGNDLLMVELLWDAGQDVAKREQLPLERRVTVMRAMVQNLTAPMEARHLLLSLETRVLLVEAKLCSQDGVLPGLCDVTVMSSSGGRLNLFEHLTSSASRKVHTQALLKLLHLWPSFDQQVYTSMSANPWEALVTRLIGEGGPGGHRLDAPLLWDTVQHAIKQGQLPAASVGHVSLQLLAAGQNCWKLAAKLALLQHNPRAVTAVLENYAIAGEVCSSDYDDELLSDLVRRGLVPRLVGGPLYEPCCQYLVRAGDIDVLQGVVEQLQHGHPQQAAALSQRVAVARPALTSITSAFRKVYSRLL